MTLEDYKILLLKQLLSKKDKKVELFKDTIDGFEQNLHKLAINQLMDYSLVRKSNAGYKITQFGEDYLTKLEYNIDPSKNDTLIHIGHNITGNVQFSDLSTKDLNLSITPPTIENNKTAKITSGILKWIITNIWLFIFYVAIAVVASVIFKKYF